MVKVIGKPTQKVGAGPVGVTVMMPVSGLSVALVAVKLGKLPVPLAAKPMAGLELVQVKVVPATLLANAGNESTEPAQAELFEMGVTTGIGLLGTLTVAEVSHKLASVTFTVYVPGVNPAAVCVLCPPGAHE